MSNYPLDQDQSVHIEEYLRAQIVVLGIADYCFNKPFREFQAVNCKNQIEYERARQIAAFARSEGNGNFDLLYDITPSGGFEPTEHLKWIVGDFVRAGLRV